MNKALLKMPTHPLRSRDTDRFAQFSTMFLIAIAIICSLSICGSIALGRTIQDQDESQSDQSIAEIANRIDASFVSLTNGRPHCETLVPDTTKALFVVRDVEELKEKLGDTVIGNIFEQEELEPFLDELRRDLENNLTDAGRKLGLRVEDIQGVRSGEVGFATIMPAEDEVAVAAIIDVEENPAEADELIATIKAKLIEEGAEELDPIVEGDHSIAGFLLPWERGALEDDHVYMIHVEGFILASDHEETCRNLVRSVTETHDESFVPLSRLPAQVAITERLLEAPGLIEPDIRWFVEPFGLFEAAQVDMAGGDRGLDLAGIFSDNGFSAIKAIGGDVSIGVGEFEVMHRTYVHAPPTANEDDRADGIRFSNAAAMLKFENQSFDSMRPFRWIDLDTSTYLSFSWDMNLALNRAAPLADRLVGDDEGGAFERMLYDLEHDPAGPGIDLRGELLENFEPRLTMITDTVRPIGVDSERVMIAIQIRNSETVAEGVTKIMEAELGMVPEEVEGFTVWRYDPEAAFDDDQDIPDIPDIDDPLGLDPFAIEVPDDEGAADPEPSLAGWNSFAVVNDLLLISNNVDMINEVIHADEARNLADTTVYHTVEEKLRAIAGDEVSFHQFGQLSDILEINFELLREGKMPESRSLIGTFLNRQLNNDEPGHVRDQQISPDSLPEGADAFQRLLEPFIGPSGWVGVTEENGWFFTGGIVRVEPIDE